MSDDWHFAEDNLARFRQTHRRALLYVTADYELPRLDIEEASKGFGGTPPAIGHKSLGAETHIYWVSWRALHSLILSARNDGFPGFSLGEANYLDDLFHVLDFRRLQDFQPFQGLKAVGAFEGLLPRVL